MKLKTNLILLNSLVISFAICFATIMFLAHLHGEILKRAEKEQAQAIATFWQLVRDKGSDIRIEENRLMAGDYVLNGNNEIPDRISEIFGGTATIFMGDERVATNVLMPDGSRAVGTRLEGVARDALFKENRNYRGEAPILGTPYFTAYDPIRDKSGKIIGALYVGIKKNEFLTAYDSLKVKIISGSVVIEIIFLGLGFVLLRVENRHNETLRQMADQIRLVIDAVPVGIAYLDAHHLYRFANRNYCRMYHRTPEEIAGTSIAETLGSNFSEEVATGIDQVMSGRAITFLNRIDDDVTCLQTSYVPHVNEQGDVIGFIVQHYDISELSKTEAALRASEGRYRTMFDTTGTATFIIEENTTVSLVNQEFIRLCGYSRDTIEGNMRWTDFVAPDCRERMLGYHRQRRIDPSLAPDNYECDIVRADGSVRSVIVHVNVIPGSGQSIASFLDISERKRAETALAEREGFLANILDCTQEGICIFDTELRIVRTNPVIEQRFADRGPLVGRKCHEAFHGGAQPCDRCPALATLENGKPAFKTFNRQEDGKELWLEIYTFPLYDTHKTRITGVVEYTRDVTERKRAEDALIAAEQQFRSLVEQSMVGVYIIQNGRFVYVNPKMTEIFGYDRDEFTDGMTHLELTLEDDRPLAAENVRRRTVGEIKSIQYEFRGVRKDGTLNHIEVYGTATLYDGKPAIIGTLLDITARKRMEEELRSSEERYRTVFETSGSAMIIIEADTTISLANDEFAKLCGYGKEEIEGRLSWVDVVASADRERMLGYHRQRRIEPSSAPATYEFRLVNREGAVRDILTSVAMLPGTDRSVQSYLDITELKQTERLLAGDKNVLELIVRECHLDDIMASLCRNVEEQSFGTLCSVLLVDESGTCLRHAAAPSLPLEYNQAIDATRIGQNIGSCGTAAWTREEVIVSDIATDPRWAKYWKLPLSFGLRACWSKPIISARGEVLGTFAIYATQSRPPSPHELFLIEHATQLAGIVIERHRSAEALRKIQLHQQAILDNIPDMVWLKDRESRYITVNRACATAWQLRPEEITGKIDVDFFPAELAAKLREEDEQVISSGKQHHFEELRPWQGGKRTWTEIIKMPVRNEQGEIIGTTGIARDIHERKLAANALQQSEERFHNIFDQSVDAIILFRMDDFTLLDANPAAVKLFGIDRTRLHELPPHSLIDRQDLLELIDTIGNDIGATCFQQDRATGIRSDDTTFPIVIRTSVLHLRDEYVVHCSIRDISEKLRLMEEVRTSQAKLIQANKMTSLGMLSSSVAHEINNPNNCIAVNAAMLTGVWQDAEPILRRHMEEMGDFPLRGLPFSRMQSMVPRLFNGIAEGSRRITAIVDNMKQYVREEKGGSKTPVDVNKLIDSAAAILWHHIHKLTDTFQVTLHDDLPMALANGQQIEQVIINLIMNALQALPDKSRGVFISTGCDRARGVVLLEVRDEGTGIEKTVMARLSEPFFTTRLDAGGTGLGLYISTSIIKEHNGTLEFMSEPGKGTVATICLPMAVIDRG